MKPSIAELLKAQSKHGNVKCHCAHATAHSTDFFVMKYGEYVPYLICGNHISVYTLLPHGKGRAFTSNEYTMEPEETFKNNYKIIYFK